MTRPSQLALIALVYLAGAGARYGPGVGAATATQWLHWLDRLDCDLRHGGGPQGRGGASRLALPTVRSRANRLIAFPHALRGQATVGRRTAGRA